MITSTLCEKVISASSIYIQFMITSSICIDDHYRIILKVILWTQSAIEMPHGLLCHNNL